MVTATKKSRQLNAKTKTTLQCYLMLSTQIIGFLVLTAYPIFWAAKWAWFYYDTIPQNTRLVGWENFVNIFSDSAYWNAWGTTLKFAACKIVIELPLAMLLAVLLNRNIKGKGFFRALFYMPNIVSVAIVGLIFSNMFDYFGVINGLLGKFGIAPEGVNWFGNVGTALMVIVIASTWSTFGTNMIYFLGALQTIPEDLYESAYLDGAKPLTVFFKITLPMIAPILQTVLLLAINGTLHINDLVLVTTNGAPGGKTFTVMSYIVKQFVPGFAEANVNIGYGSAMALITSAIYCIVGVTYSKLSKRLSEIY